jgi:hypothetical protein
MTFRLKINYRMKKIILTSILALISATTIFAQSEYDALRYSQSDITGSARYVGMAGAFGALGGDMSSIGINPAGIAVYRSSELAFTPVFTNAKTSSDFDGIKSSDSKLKLQVNNFGYVGSFRTGEKANISNFNFGISYNKLKDFNRNVSIVGKNRSSSLLDNVCSNIPVNTYHEDLADLPWMSYQTYLINPENNGTYSSVLYPNEKLNSSMYLDEKGEINEWSFTLGANWAHFLYIGASVNFLDMNYVLMSSYKEESLDQIFNYELRNALSTDGGGINAKIGAILRPIPNLRFGFAIHTPTYYTLTDTYGASLESKGVEGGGYTEHTAEIKESYYNYQLITPGKLMYSAAYQIGKKAIVSMDIDVIDYRETKIKNENGVPLDNRNSDIQNHFRSTTNFRLGGEYRLNDNVSLRAGTAWYSSANDYNNTSRNVKVNTVGTTPNYSFDKGARYTSLGIGYRTGSFFLDVATINQTVAENFFNFFDAGSSTDAKYAELKTSKSNINVSLGFRF